MSMPEMVEVEVNITEDEAALYDRQIRLWGLDAQKRLRAATVLLIGLGGVGAEIAKNVILSGVKSITLLDDALVSEEEKCFQFLIDSKSIGKNRAESSRARAQLLNPMVDVQVDTESSETKPAAYFHNFNIVCATGCSLKELYRLDGICHEAGVKFFAGDVFGFYAFMFADLNTHSYSEDVVSHKKKVDDSDASGEPTLKKLRVEHETKTVKKTCEFPSLKDALDADWTTKENAAKLRRKSPQVYFITRILLEFRTRTGHSLHAGSPATEKRLLQDIRTELLAEFSVEMSIVAENFTDFCVSEFNPVCAILGGVISAEIIKAVSLRDSPINNFFFYNGIDGCGSVDKLG